MNFESQVMQIPIDDIIPNRFQPRLSFDEKAMEELTSSIKEHGIIQPLVVRRVGNKYEIIAGERRYKASTLAGLKEVPAIITAIDDNKSAEVALVENVQRKNLSPIEEAKAFKTILDRGYITQEGLSKKIGTSQSAIANKMRLLNLCSEVQHALIEEKISERHARSLLQIQDVEIQKQMLKRIIEERLTVRQLDAEIANMNNGGQKVVDQTPLVDIYPTVDEIKLNATEINPIKEIPSLESMLRPNDVQPSSQIAKKVEVPSGKFFNFLEDEEANMNVAKEEPSIIPTNMGITPFEPPKVEENNNVFSNTMPPLNSSVQPVEEFKNLNSINVPNPVATAFEPLNDIATPLTPAIESLPVEEPQPIVSNVVKEPSVEVLDIVPESINTSVTTPIAVSNETMYQEPDTSNLIDPISQIEKLSPDYVPPVNINPNDNILVNGINNMRDTLKEIEDSGLMVENDEIDLPNIYQFIIKITKPKD